jgi:5-(carboxyamino)imidazole ribonucleotide synthase
MVGAGQLARMTHRAAIDLGAELRVLAADRDDPAVLAGAPHLLGSPERLEDLRALARDCDVVTMDHEHVSPAHLAALEAEGARLEPGAAPLLFAQDKLHARRELAGLGLPVPPFAPARTREDAERFAAAHGWPLVAKAPRGGYDGRGVWTLADGAAAARLLAESPGGLVLEPRLELVRELAVLVARSPSGERVAYPVVETVQRDAMCREIVAPAPVAPGIAREACELALEVAERIGATGILAVELFLTAGGLSINELALRPHNSGHYTLGGCVTSQFEQHLRAVLDWPLGDPSLHAPAVCTVNVVGGPGGEDPRRRVAAALSVSGAQVHLYDKQPRPGRKLGHVTVCGAEPAAAREAALRAAGLLEGGR